jgi:hypothetical protein
MTIQFNCVQCQKAIETPDDSAGKKCRCPDCGQVMSIPDPEVPIGQSFDPGINPQKSSENSANPYSAPPAPSMPPHPPTGSNYYPADKSGLVLVMGITSIVVSLMSCSCCLLFFPIGLGLGIPAWVMGKNDLRMIAQGQRDPSQKSMLQAGMTCGIVGVGLTTLSLIINAAMIVFQIGAFGFN